MHEYAIAQGVIGIAIDHAGGRRVAAVDLKAGQLRQVVPSALEFAFGIAAEGTLVEGAELRLTTVQPGVRCGDCDVETACDGLPLHCGLCGSFDVTLVAGEELEVESIEVFNEHQEEEAPTPGQAKHEQAPDAGQEVV